MHNFVGFNDLQTSNILKNHVTNTEIVLLLTLLTQPHSIMSFVV